jgi:hypothetical protein
VDFVLPLPKVEGYPTQMRHFDVHLLRLCFRESTPSLQLPRGVSQPILLFTDSLCRTTSKAKVSVKKVLLCFPRNFFFLHLSRRGIIEISSVMNFTAFVRTMFFLLLSSTHQQYIDAFLDGVPVSDRKATATSRSCQISSDVRS